MYHPGRQQGRRHRKWYNKHTAEQRIAYVHKYVQLAPSQLPGAGTGAFWAGIPIPPFTVLGAYEGVLRDQLVTGGYDPAAHGGHEYCVKVGHMCIDASDPASSGWSRYVNDATGPGRCPTARNNVGLAAEGSVCLMTDCHWVWPGDELCMSYGVSYWRSRGHW